MKGFINKDFYTVFLPVKNMLVDIEDIEEMEESGDEDLNYFLEGDEVEILRVIEDESFNSGFGYVILNIENNASTTVDPMWVTLENKYK